jgi:hypothetical protein
MLPIYYKNTQIQIDNMKSSEYILANCESCNNEFSFQKKYFTRDLKNNYYRTTCSYSCFSKLKFKSKKIITNCKNCNKEITKYEKDTRESKSGFVFCSRSCSATHNNPITKLKYLDKNCINCNILYRPTNNKTLTCSLLCNMENYSKSIKASTIIKRTGANAYDSIRKNARSYSKYILPLKCMKCDYDKHYEVCHIKPIRDFDATTCTVYDINNKQNLIHLCPNCHWEFDNGLTSLETITTLIRENTLTS